MIIGIIAAEEEEMLAIKEIMSRVSEEQVYNLNFVHGEIEGKEIVLVKCGVGKVNSARTTQVLIDKFDAKYIINVGSACGLNDSLKVGDIVIGNQLVQHDFDISKVGNYEKGEICRNRKIYKL